ncbi:MAG: nickel-responsive transcriptional regulator NikR [Rhizobacter sp.]|nr:nickel-responsive transcriptional regulator NikR [Rhizobacter sp.]
MQRFTISLDDDLAEAFDALIAQRQYANRSEAVRDLLRAELDKSALDESQAGDCVASLSYVFNHHERDLSERLTALAHDHHDLTLCTMHAHLDHDDCLETQLLRGKTVAVRAFADQMIAERGVRHGKVNIISAVTETSSRHRHPHGKVAGGSGSAHVHIKPRR